MGNKTTKTPPQTKMGINDDENYPLINDSQTNFRAFIVFLKKNQEELNFHFNEKDWEAHHGICDHVNESFIIRCSLVNFKLEEIRIISKILKDHFINVKGAVKWCA